MLCGTKADKKQKVNSNTCHSRCCFRLAGWDLMGLAEGTEVIMLSLVGSS